jgi:hypothetical protein
MSLVALPDLGQEVRRRALADVPLVLPAAGDDRAVATASDDTFCQDLRLATSSGFTIAVSTYRSVPARNTGTRTANARVLRVPRTTLPTTGWPVRRIVCTLSGSWIRGSGLPNETLVFRIWRPSDASSSVASHAGWLGMLRTASR